MLLKSFLGEAQASFPRKLLGEKWGLSRWFPGAGYDVAVVIQAVENLVAFLQELLDGARLTILFQLPEDLVRIHGLIFELASLVFDLLNDVGHRDVLMAA